MASKTADELASALYDKCASDFPPDHSFYQEDLSNLGIIPSGNLQLLQECAQILVDRSQFRMLHGKGDKLVWKVIAQSDAEK